MTTLHLSALEEALTSLENVASEELTFDVGGIPVTLRVLLPKEEIAIQKYAQESISDEEESDNSTVMEYLDRYKWGVCSHAIVVIGNLDFRDVEYVETGEVLENGTPVKIPKHEAVRGIIEKKWGRIILNGVFKKYGELVGKVEEKSEKLIEFEPTDLDTEIERLEARLADLRNQKEEELEGKKETTLSAQIKAIENMEAAVSQGEAAIQRMENATEMEEAELVESETETGSEEVASEEPAPPDTGAPVIPQSAAPPPPKAQVVSQPPRQAREPAPSAASQAVMADHGSFADLSDPSTAQNIMETEARRILLLRQKDAQEREGQVPPSDLQPETPDELVEARTGGSSLRPPHAAAQAAAEEAGELTVAQAGQGQVGNLDGVPVYQMSPTESLEKARQAMRPGQQGGINQPAKGTRNPRFQPPKGR